ncbi:hypothetical protein [Elioraea thermophila]|uniref:hypothetical protein n=1 Tax=Elioraea thermophila TaxID=2185104 RepID=UPI000DF20D56|nr:hypothetical protein [Elioraea thermophila]
MAERTRHAALALLPALAAVPLGTASALAAEAACRITYAEFEPAVPHVDLAACPGRPQRQGEFCRAQILGQQITIYRFETGPDDTACLADAEMMTIRDFLARHGVTAAAR